MRTKKALSWIFSLALAATMIPALGSVAYADEGGPAPGISIGAGNIEKGNKVYMGVRKTDDGIVPISWVVLGGANSSDLEDSVGAAVSSDNARLLITEKTLARVQFDSDGQSNTWQGSNIQNWCSEFLTDADGDNYSGFQDRFSALEEATALSTSKTDDEYDDEWGTSELKNEKLFLLSAEEVSGGYGYFNDDESRIAYWHDEDETWNWWLRSPFSDLSNYAACVKSDGSVGVSDVGILLGARPAFNFDLASVLFTSAAVGGKSSGACGADALSAISGNATNEWKLTLLDRSRTFEASFIDTSASHEETSGYSGWTENIQYSGAGTGENEYVSVILTGSDGKALYYGNIVQNSASGTVDIRIPDGLAAGTYTLNVFSEQKNADYVTDYASAFEQLNITVASPQTDSVTPLVDIGNVNTNLYAGEGAAFTTEINPNEKVDETPLEDILYIDKEYWTDTETGDKVDKDSGTFVLGHTYTYTAEICAVQGWVIDKNFTFVYGGTTYTPTLSDYEESGTGYARVVLTGFIDPVTVTSGGAIPAVAKLSNSSFVYNGKVQKPTVTVTATVDGTTVTLKENEDYELHYSNADSMTAGKYMVEVWGTNPKYDAGVALIYTITPAKVAVPSGKTLTYNGKAQTGVSAGANYTVTNGSQTNAGTYTATLSLKDKTNYTWSDGTTTDKSVKWTISQAANPLKMKPKTATVKYKKLKKKTRTLAVTKVIKFTKKLNDKKTYTLVSAKKGSKSFKKYFKINKTTGKATVKRGLKKGTYKITVKVKAAGNANYAASSAKPVTFTIKVK